MESRQRKDRLRKSCEACRYAKCRCLPSVTTDAMERCQRCTTEDRACVFLKATPRPKKIKSSKARVDDMEQKLDGIFRMLSSQTNEPQPILTPPTSTPSAMPMPSIPPDPCDTHFGGMPMDSEPSATYDLPFESFREAPIGGGPDVLSRGIISYARAEASISTFRRRSRDFPFILLPLNTTMEGVRRNRPMLFLAILASSNEDDRQVSQKLETTLRLELMTKIVMEGLSSIDLLQALVILIAYFYLHYKPKDNHVYYQLIQMSTALASTLELTKPSPSAMASHLSEAEIECRRTFLGCYWICSLLSQTTCKPSILYGNEFVLRSSQLLAELQRVETDKLLPHLIRLQLLADEVHDTFDYSVESKDPQYDCVRIGVMLKHFRQKMKDISEEVPAEYWSHPMLPMLRHNIGIYISNIGFYSASPASSTRDDTMQAVIPCSHQQWYSSPLRAECLLRALHDTKAFLEYVVTLSQTQIASFLTHDFLWVIDALLRLGNFTMGMGHPSLDPLELRQTADLAHHLDALGQKFRSIAIWTDGGLAVDLYASGNVNGGCRAVLGSVCANPSVLNMAWMFEQLRRWHDDVVRMPPLATADVRRSSNGRFRKGLLPSLGDLARREPTLPWQGFVDAAAAAAQTAQTRKGSNGGNGGNGGNAAGTTTDHHPPSCASPSTATETSSASSYTPHIPDPLILPDGSGNWTDLDLFAEWLPQMPAMQMPTTMLDGGFGKTLETFLERGGCE